MNVDYYDYQYGTTLANPHYRSSSNSLGALIVLIVICVFVCGGCGKDIELYTTNITAMIRSLIKNTTKRL